MDERQLEMAEALAAEQLERALANLVRYEGESLTECEDCGNEIPQGRREAVKGCRLCTECQEIQAKRTAGVRRV